MESTCYVPATKPYVPMTDNSGRTSSNGTSSRQVELSCMDLMGSGVNVRIALYFDQVVSKGVLKASLSEVLSRFPLLTTRVIRSVAKKGRSIAFYQYFH